MTDLEKKAKLHFFILLGCTTWIGFFLLWDFASLMTAKQFVSSVNPTIPQSEISNSVLWLVMRGVSLAIIVPFLFKAMKVRNQLKWRS